MKQFLVVLPLVLASTLVAQDVRIITTQPDLADLARMIGGQDVRVDSLSDGDQDLHLIKVRPSHLVLGRKADLFVQLGFDAEHAWVPGLLAKCRNRDIQPGGKGFVNASHGVKPLGVPTKLTRARGVDLHPGGNPHYNLDPERMRFAARNIAAGLINVAPDDADAIRKRLAAFEKRLDGKMAEWNKRLAAARGKAFVEHHESWAYFAERFGLRVVATLEPGPGMPPTAKHLSKVIQTCKTEKVRLVVATPGSIGVARKVANDTGAEAVSLPLASSKEGKLSGWFNFMDHVVETFATALGSSASS